MLFTTKMLLKTLDATELLWN